MLSCAFLVPGNRPANVRCIGGVRTQFTSKHPIYTPTHCEIHEYSEYSSTGGVLSAQLSTLSPARYMGSIEHHIRGGKL